MKKWLTSVFLLLAIIGGVFAGSPLHADNKQMMDCCDKAKSPDRSPIAQAARLCCAVNCSNSAPTTSGFATNFAPSSTAIAASVAEQIAALFSKERPQRVAAPSHLHPNPPQSLQPTYIRHKALLI